MKTDTISPSSLTIEMVAVTRDLRWTASRGDSQPPMPHSPQIQCVWYEKRKVEWEAQSVMCQLSTSTLQNSYGCTALDMPEWREMAKQIDWPEKAAIKSGLRPGRSEVLRSLGHYLWAQSQGHRTMDRLEERGVERESARRSSLKGRERATANQTNIGTILK